jgi:hypothetical protein
MWLYLLGKTKWQASMCGPQIFINTIGISEDYFMCQVKNPFFSCYKVSNINKTDETNSSGDSKKPQENQKKEK